MWSDQAPERRQSPPTDVHLNRELEKLVESKVRKGRYSSARDGVREAFMLLEEHDHIGQMRVQEMRHRIQEDWDSPRRSEGVDREGFMA